MRSHVSAALAALALLPVSAYAGADTRYATPNPAPGATCDQGSPCSFKTAIEGAHGSDIVIVGGGNYTVAGPVNGYDKNGLEIRGNARSGRPKVTINTQSGVSALFLAAGVKVSDLDIACPADGVSCLFASSGANLQRLSVAATGSEATAIYVRSTDATGTFLSNVFARGNGTGTELHDTNATVQSVTSVGGEFGLIVKKEDYTNHSVTVRNSILQGATYSLALAGSNGITVDIDYSAFTTVYNGTNALGNGTHNVGAPAQFVSATDLHQAAGSPTIDKGTTTLVMPDTDIDGDPRSLGAAVDIGADEFRAPPIVATGVATNITDTAATLTGAVDRQGGQVKYRFDYGPTTAYGKSTTLTAVMGSGSQLVSEAIAGLAPSTTYHYRLAVLDSHGIAFNGADQKFTTGAAKTGGGDGGGGGGDGGGGSGSGSGGGDGSGTGTGSGDGGGTQIAPRQCVVPKLKGLRLRTARERLRAAGCRLGTITGQRGRIKSQSRRPGRRLKVGSKVGVTLRH